MSFDNLYFNKVHYYFDTFSHLENFDIIPYQKVVDLYLKNHTTLKKSNQSFGENERPLNSKVDKLDRKGFWFGFAPMYFEVDKYVQTKADVISMDMVGVGETWDNFIYLTIPGELINKFMNSVHDNEDLTLAKQFIDEVEKKDPNWETEYYLELQSEYDKRYNEHSEYTDYFETHKVLKWRQDISFEQYQSIKQNGLIYPICYNNSEEIFDRGTHRAVFLAKSKSDVPVFIQFPIDKPLNMQIHTPPHFRGSKLLIDLDIHKKNMEFKFKDS
jgi:hypothetical protein